MKQDQRIQTPLKMQQTLKRLSMTVLLWAPIVQMPEITEDQQYTRDVVGHCKICGLDVFYMCLPWKCPLRKRW